MSAPVVNGDPVARVVEVAWEVSDDEVLTSLGGWVVAGRALIEWPQGGLANGLLLRNANHEQRVVIWERPKDGGRGRFRMVPLGTWR